MIGKYNRSVILTYIGVCISAAGIFLTINGKFEYAMISLIYAGICDLFDGVIARRCERTEEEKAFGVQIDSLADVVSFLVFPAVIGMKLISGNLIFCVTAAAVYLLAGIIRLGWFNIKTDVENSVKYYEGLPVTYMALILPTIYLFGRLTNLNLSVFWAVVYIMAALCFVLPFRIAKPKGIWYIVFSLLAVMETILLLYAAIWS